MDGFVRSLWRAELASAAGLDRRRVLVASGVLLVLEIAVFLFLIAGTHGWIVPPDRPTTTDFASFYSAGSLADAGTPQLAYDQAAHYAAEQQATAPGIEYQFFYYPPVFLLICAALARMPYLIAFAVFEAATLLLCLFVARSTLNEKRWIALVPLLAFPAVFWTLGLGQNAFLTAALFGGALLVVDRRPAIAGVLFGLLCYKPHFGLLVPVALAAGCRWRSLAAAALAAAAVAALSATLFGWQTWQDYVALAGGSHATYEFGRIDFSGFVTLFGALRLMDVAPAPAYAVQAIGTLTAVVLVAIVWRRALSLPVRAAALAAATLIAVPVALIYDFVLAGLAMAWLARAGAEKGFLPWEKATLAAIFIAPLLSRNLGTALHVPLATLALLALLALIVRRARSELLGRCGADAPSAVHLAAATRTEAQSLSR
ncbi:MAG TPA: glycosyltransferase family 87 protein [Stellaceae bacterium]|jgi:hypothetical protein